MSFCMPRTELQPPPLSPSVSLHPPLDFIPCPLCAPLFHKTLSVGEWQHPAKCQGGALTASAMEQALTARLLPIALCHCPGTTSVPALGTGHSSGRLLCSPWPLQPPSSALQEFLLLLSLCCSDVSSRGCRPLILPGLVRLVPLTQHLSLGK